MRKLDNKIAEITLSEPQKIGDMGDVWETAWADDDNLYLVADDGRGLSGSFEGNLVYCRLTGDVDGIKVPGNGTTINPMTEYGTISQLGPDGGNWKANGTTCVDGVLYIWVSRHNYWGKDFEEAVNRQTAYNSSLIKSTDYGKTWTRTAQQNYDQPMFPGRRFGAPFFIQYGKNYGDGAHGSDRFVYAVSNNGYWDNGDDMILGRVPRNKIAELQASDWQFHKGGDGGDDASWSNQIEDAKPIISNPGKCSMTGAVWIAPLKKYRMIQWYYTNAPGHVDSKDTTWLFLESPTPWGPWREVGNQRFDTLGFYNPSIVNKFTRDGGENLTIFTAGDFVTRVYYCLTLMNCRISVP